MIVLDAGIWATALADASPLGDRCREAMVVDHAWVAPSHAATEVLRTIRRFEQAGRLTSAGATSLAGRVAAAAVRYVEPQDWLISAQWALRHNVSAYDAAYVVLARRFVVPLLTTDARLARAATALGADIRLVSATGPVT